MVVHSTYLNLQSLHLLALAGTVLVKGGRSFPDVTVAGTSLPQLTHVADVEVPWSGFKSVFVALTLSTNRPLAHCKSSYNVEQVLREVLTICFDVLARPAQLGSAEENGHVAALCGYVQQFAKTIQMILVQLLYIHVPPIESLVNKVHVYSRVGRTTVSFVWRLSPFLLY